MILVDTTLKEPIGECPNERVCTFHHVERKAGVHKYAAVVAGLRGVPEDKLPRSNTVRVLWLNVDLELSAYAEGREPADDYPALLCDPEGCSTNTVGLGMGVALYVKANRRLPEGVEMLVERKVSVGRDVMWRGPGGDLSARCLAEDGCATSGLKTTTPTSETFFASLYLARKEGGLPSADAKLLSSNRIRISWKDWTPAVTFDPGPRTCDSSGKNCVYSASTLSATVPQPLEPGVVVILYMAQNCVPQPGDPRGDKECNAYSPKDCSPPSRTCTFKGAVSAGYRPGAVVVDNGPRPMLLFGSAFLQSLP